MLIIRAQAIFKGLFSTTGCCAFLFGHDNFIPFFIFGIFVFYAPVDANHFADLVNTVILFFIQVFDIVLLGHC